MATVSETSEAPTIAEQTPLLLGQAAGYAGHRTIALGLRAGLIEALAAAPDGLSSDALARRLQVDELYAAVWCRAAVAAGVCDVTDEVYRLAPHMDTLLLDEGSPAYVGGLFTLLEQFEVFDRFERVLETGERLWWDQCSPEWIAGVARTGAPFYARLVPDGLAVVPGLHDRLAEGGRIVDTACGTGSGLLRLATHYPAARLVGVDGDAASLDAAQARLEREGLAERVELVHSPLERMRLHEPATLVINNISMHECRDIDLVTEQVSAALEPGGWFVISDVPFPERVEGLRTVPGRVMSAIQFFEAQIDDQLLPRSAYDDLLERHGFVGLGSVEPTPMHAVTWGRRS